MEEENKRFISLLSDTTFKYLFKNTEILLLSISSKIQNIESFLIT